MCSHLSESSSSSSKEETLEVSLLSTRSKSQYCCLSGCECVRVLDGAGEASCWLTEELRSLLESAPGSLLFLLSQTAAANANAN